MSTAAERMRRMRERRRSAEGRAKIAVGVNVDRLALALVEDGFLAAWDDTDPAAIETALKRMVETYIADLIGPEGGA